MGQASSQEPGLTRAAPKAPRRDGCSGNGERRNFDFSDRNLVLQDDVENPDRCLCPIMGSSKTERENDHQGYDFDFVFAGSEYIMNVRGLVSLLEEHGQ